MLINIYNGLLISINNTSVTSNRCMKMLKNCQGYSILFLTIVAKICISPEFTHLVTSGSIIWTSLYLSPTLVTSLHFYKFDS